MHHGTDIRIPKALRRSLSVILALLIFIQSNQAVAINAEGLVAMPAVQAMLIAIANVNRAMRDAAENPMDKWRRENVQTAIRAMPAAIIGLAGEFQSGNLHEKDYPLVMSMLGGFVDVNAADAYKKFLNKPSADLIPKMGQAFPQQYIGPTSNGQGQHQSVVFDDGASKGSAGTNAAIADSPNLVKAAAMKGIGEKQDKAADSLGVIFDDEVKKAAETTPTSARTTKAPANTSSDDSTMSRLERAMGGASAQTASASPSYASAPAYPPVASASGGSASALTNTTIIRRGPTAVENSLDSDFFEKADAPKKGKARADYQLKVKPKYFQAASRGMLLEAILFERAVHAQGGGCDGSCGDKGGGGGQAIAQILMGVAAIIADIAPMVVAGIQAEAEKDIARTQAMAQIEMTNISAATSKFISDQNTKVTLEQTATAERINRLNQDGVSQRLDMQLAELRSAREDAAQREKDRLAEEKRLNEERIALAKKQADDNLKLARQSLNAQLTQAGLTSGFGNSRNSSTGGLTSTTLAGQVAAQSTAGTSVAGTAGTAASGVGVAASNQNRTVGNRIDNQSSSSGLGVTLGNSNSNGYGSVPSTYASSGSSSSAGGGAGISIGDRISASSAPSNRAVADSRSRLVSSATGGGVASAPGSAAASGSPASLAAPNLIQGAAPNASGVHGFAAGKPLVASASESRALQALLNGPGHRGIRGSSSIQRVNITSSDMASAQPVVASGGGDLTSFTESASENTSFAAARRVRVVAEPEMPAGEKVPNTVLDTNNLHNPPFPGSSHSGATAD